MLNLRNFCDFLFRSFAFVQKASIFRHFDSSPPLLFAKRALAPFRAAARSFASELAVSLASMQGEAPSARFGRWLRPASRGGHGVHAGAHSAGDMHMSTALHTRAELTYICMRALRMGARRSSSKLFAAKLFAANLQWVCSGALDACLATGWRLRWR